MHKLTFEIIEHIHIKYESVIRDNSEESYPILKSNMMYTIFHMIKPSINEDLDFELVRDLIMLSDTFDDTLGCLEGKSFEELLRELSIRRFLASGGQDLMDKCELYLYSNFKEKKLVEHISAIQELVTIILNGDLYLGKAEETTVNKLKATLSKSVYEIQICCELRLDLVGYIYNNERLYISATKEK